MHRELERASEREDSVSLLSWLMLNTFRPTLISKRIAAGLELLYNGSNNDSTSENSADIKRQTDKKAKGKAHLDLR